MIDTAAPAHCCFPSGASRNSGPHPRIWSLKGCLHVNPVQSEKQEAKEHAGAVDLIIVRTGKAEISELAG